MRRGARRTWTARLGWVCLVLAATGCAGPVLGQLSRDVALVRTAMHHDQELFVDGPPFVCSLVGRPRRELERSLGRADECSRRWVREKSGEVSCAYYLYTAGPETLLPHGVVFVITYDASDRIVDARYYRE